MSYLFTFCVCMVPFIVRTTVVELLLTNKQAVGSIQNTVSDSYFFITS